jgi:hypothetical protein
MSCDVPQRGIKTPRSARELGVRLRTIASNQADPSEWKEDSPFSGFGRAMRIFLGSPRLTLRSLMLFVVVVGVPLGWAAQFYRARVASAIAYHKVQEMRLLRAAANLERKAAVVEKYANHRQSWNNLTKEELDLVFSETHLAQRAPGKPGWTVNERDAYIKRYIGNNRLTARSLRIQAKNHADLARP